jgi:di/tricarboxylate transporter
MFLSQEAILVIVLALALLLILSNRLRADLVAVLVMLALGITGVVTPEQALSGFSQPVVITLIGMFVMTRALEDTGVIQWIGNRLRVLGAGSEKRLVLVSMGSGSLLALFMNLVAAGALLLPAVAQAARDSNVQLSKVLIPLSFGTLLGGTATLFATANLIMSSLLVENGQTPLGITDFLPTGSLIVLAGLLYMGLIGRRLLPDRQSGAQRASAAAVTRSLFEAYQLEERLWEAKVTPWSPLIDKPLSKSQIGEKLGVTVLAIWRGHHAILTPTPDEVLRAHDYLLILGREDRVSQIVDWGVVLGRDLEGGHNLGAGLPVDLSEVIIPPRSNVIGKTLTDLRFRNKYGLTTVALWRGGRSYRTDVGTFPLQVGDALLMVGPVPKIRALAQERDYMVLQSSHNARPRAPQKAILSVVVLLGALLLSILRILPTAEAVLLGAAVMVLTNCINMDEAYRAIEWRVIFLIAGMLPLSIGLIDTGLASRIGDAVTSVVAPYGEVGLIISFFCITLVVVQTLGSQVTAIIVGPIALTAALEMGVNPHAVAVAVATACATAFLTPMAHPVNLLMMGAAGYEFGDFAKVGAGMTVVVFIVLLAGLYLFWGVS